MNSRAFFESLWSEPVTAEEERPPLCRFAAEFQPWAEALLSNTLGKRSMIGINQAKLLLLDKYFEWRNVAPRGHRDKMSTTGHCCLWHVFEAAYNRLREAELTLTPPILDTPSASRLALPSPPPPAQIAGIFIGEEE